MSKKTLFAQTLILLAFFIVVPTAFAESEDQVNYWTFDEATGRSVNDSVGGQNGVLTGSSTGFGWASGKSGTALGMDGLPGESVALPDGMLKGSEGSIALWFKLNSLSERNILFSGKSTSNNSVYITLAVDSEGRPQVQFRDSATGYDRKAQGAQILNTNEWYNLVLTANSQTYRMYINGVPIDVAGTNLGRWFPDMTNQTLMYRIGALDSSPLTGVLDGYIDDVRIYDRVLNTEEVGAVYEKGNLSSPTVPLSIRPVLVFSSANASVPGSVLLEWSSKNVTSCISSGGWSGAVELSGSKTIVKPASDTSYAITCKGQGGEITETVLVSVGALETESSTLGSKETITETVITLPPSAPLNDAARKELIAKLINQIMLLIVELQKQVDILKAAAR